MFFCGDIMYMIDFLVEVCVAVVAILVVDFVYFWFEFFNRE